MIVLSVCQPFEHRDMYNILSMVNSCFVMFCGYFCSTFQSVNFFKHPGSKHIHTVDMLTYIMLELTKIHVIHVRMLCVCVRAALFWVYQLVLYPNPFLRSLLSILSVCQPFVHRDV